MPRIKIDLPESFSFSTRIAVRITDINYGGHAGNDAILSIIHEARIQFLQQHGYQELNIGKGGLIMSDVVIEFKNELFYGDVAIVSVGASNYSRASFDIYYKLEKTIENKNTIVAVAKTGMVCYDYQLKKVCVLPDDVRMKLSE